MTTTLADTIAVINDRIAAAARRSGREREAITLVAAAKTVESDRIVEAIAAGITTVGENYVQDARKKIETIGRRSTSWHFIGHLQKNKVKYAVDLFDMIQTVDSIELAREIDRRSRRPMDVLIEVNLGGEKTKSGVSCDEAVELAATVATLDNLTVRGLMSIPPPSDDPRQSRPYFARLRELLEEIKSTGHGGEEMTHLSMGMSRDFEIAIEEGATMVRLGTALFGKRIVGDRKAHAT